MKLRCDVAGIIILWFILGAGVMSLGGCAQKTPVENAFAEAEQAMTAVRKTLPAECMTPEVEARLDAIESKYKMAQMTCEKQIKAEQIKYSNLMMVLVVWIFLFIARFFLKKM